MEPCLVGVPADDRGPDVDAMAALASGARLFYLAPNFQNPTGRTIGEARRAAIAEQAARMNLPLVEDNPYGELWFEAPPPPCLAGRHPHGSIYLGSFSKVLAPGLRLGYIVAPPTLIPKLLQAKQAADLHTPSFNQRIVYEVIRDGFLQQHVPTIRALYKAQRDAMLAALARHMPEGVRWTRPAGGMFLWLRLPAMQSATELWPRAVAQGVAFVPGAPFYAGEAEHDTLRLSFVTATAEQIDSGIATLARVLREATRDSPVP
jgi:2-aminoadipate transaminase